MRFSKIMRRWKAAMVLTLFSFLLLTSASSHAQELNTDSAVPQLDVCGDFQPFVVRIQKGSLSCASSALKIKLPSGFQLKSQSVLVNGIQANVSDQTDQEVTVSFNLPAGPHSEEIEVSFQAKALCELIGSSIADPTIAYTLSGCNLGEIKGTSEAINIRFAVLRVSVTPDPILGNIGDQIERSIRIKNQGNGSISSIHLERTLGDGLSHISYDFSSLTALG